MKFFYLINKLLKFLLFVLNKLPKWSRFIIIYIFIVTILILFKNNTGVGIEEYILNVIFLKWLIWGNVIANLFLLLEHITSLYISSNKNKISLPKYTPNKIIDWYNTIYNISNSENSNIFNKIYYSSALLNILFLIICIIGLFIIMLV